MVLEAVHPLPGEPDVVEAAEGKRVSVHELGVRLRRGQHEPRQRDDEEDREHEQHERAQAERDAAPGAVGA